MDDHGGIQREGSTTVQPGLSWGEWQLRLQVPTFSKVFHRRSQEKASIFSRFAAWLLLLKGEGKKNQFFQGKDGYEMTNFSNQDVLVKETRTLDSKYSSLRDGEQTYKPESGKRQVVGHGIHRH